MHTKILLSSPFSTPSCFYLRPTFALSLAPSDLNNELAAFSSTQPPSINSVDNFRRNLSQNSWSFAETAKQSNSVTRKVVASPSKKEGESKTHHDDDNIPCFVSRVTSNEIAPLENKADTFGYNNSESFIASR